LLGCFDCPPEILCGLVVFAVFVLDVSDVVEANSCRLIVWNGFLNKHVAGLCKINNGQGIFFFFEIVVFKLFGFNKLSKDFIEVSNFSARIILLFKISFHPFSNNVSHFHIQTTEGSENAM